MRIFPCRAFLEHRQDSQLPRSPVRPQASRTRGRMGRSPRRKGASHDYPQHGGGHVGGASGGRRSAAGSILRCEETRDREHHYKFATCWTGNLGSSTSAYSAYSRNHELSAPGKSAPIAGSSDPAFRGDPTRYNPESEDVIVLADGTPPDIGTYSKQDGACRFHAPSNEARPARHRKAV